MWNLEKNTTVAKQPHMVGNNIGAIENVFVRPPPPTSKLDSSAMHTPIKLKCKHFTNIVMGHVPVNFDGLSMPTDHFTAMFLWSSSTPSFHGRIHRVFSA